MSAPTSADALAQELEIRQGLARLFEAAMRDGRTPPLTALESVARALGAVYREIAAVHLDPAGCPCGWKPEEGDLLALSEAMRGGARPARPPRTDLHRMEPAGHA
ncbi:hypothetical protein D3218_08815 [Aureimonas flava]|uniref:Uncharacterized protein n=1 Tax=Aureimonas flava TaxID=2320271 RepID=A0A3A1WNJ9_9HYPH|nr:hypothetical protein [Aureimonas flava]RIY01443.1 hypothetical protein D3218_08815 [Aureimonas flava]